MNITNQLKLLFKVNALIECLTGIVHYTIIWAEHLFTSLTTFHCTYHILHKNKHVGYGIFSTIPVSYSCINVSLAKFVIDPWDKCLGTLYTVKLYICLLLALLFILLQPDAIVVPAAATVYVQLFQSPHLWTSHNLDPTNVCIISV